MERVLERRSASASPAPPVGRTATKTLLALLERARELGRRLSAVLPECPAIASGRQRAASSRLRGREAEPVELRDRSAKDASRIRAADDRAPREGRRRGRDRGLPASRSSNSAISSDGWPGLDRHEQRARGVIEPAGRHRRDGGSEDRPLDLGRRPPDPVRHAIAQFLGFLRRRERRERRRAGSARASAACRDRRRAIEAMRSPSSSTRTGSSRSGGKGVEAGRRGPRGLPSRRRGRRAGTRCASGGRSERRQRDFLAFRERHAEPGRTSAARAARAKSDARRGARPLRSAPGSARAERSANSSRRALSDAGIRW